jgi:hypothetical protein
MLRKRFLAQRRRQTHRQLAYQGAAYAGFATLAHARDVYGDPFQLASQQTSSVETDLCLMVLYPSGITETISR